MENFAARQVIEYLRSGVSSRNLSAIFSYGREAACERVGRELERVRSDGGAFSLVVKGNFGNGKTHFLNIIAHKAQELNFAVSFVPLSKETPFDKLDRLYRRAAAGLYLPGCSQPGFVPLLEALQPGSDQANEMLNYAARNLHPKLEAVLKNYLDGSGDAYNQHILAGDLAGDFVPTTQLKSIHRLNFGKGLSLPPFKVKENTFDYFRFLSRLIRAAGYAGWVILFDEFEQLMYLGITARASAYLNAARFMSPSFGLTATYTVFAASSNLWSELIWKQKNSDYDIVPQKLAAKERQYDIPTVREVFGSFLKENLFLDTLSTFDIRRMLQAVRDQHALAYGWQAPDDISRAKAGLPADRPLRTVIRAVVEYLDLQYLYGGRPEIAAAMPEEILPGDLPEDEREEQEKIQDHEHECL
ncbi:BREX system ATP-binding domain-containing protein [Pelotomaculum propionicicum]|uniref:ATP-binding protein n=1 Tax=Pelotomaculum propionicicum TaxID=258475 RepID=A0A4Y7RPW4_9FIRM|nr:BREX system ATP-binding domain-containing protein [Pelotomaculum propionicicum]TEB10780.1 hypothetical protein Pmgp_02095 [Pelotomaculum propionicicum]